MFDEDGEEEKGHRRVARRLGTQPVSSYLAPASAVAAATVIGVNGNTLAHVLEQHFHAQLSPHSGENRAILASVTGTTFADWAYCNLTKRASAHAQIVEREPLMAPEQYSTECGRCPVNGQCVVSPVMRQSPPRNPDEAVAVRTLWLAAKARLANETNLMSARRVNHPDPASLALPVSAIQNERDAWIGYMLVAFDVVRAHVIQRYHAIHGARSSSSLKPSPNLPRYERFLRDAAEDLISRNGTHIHKSRFQSGAAVSTARLFCFRHNRVGHMFPLLGFRAYDTGCFICPLEVNRPPPTDDLSRNRITDAAELRRMCGDPSQARIDAKNQQFVDESSAR